MTKIRKLIEHSYNLLSPLTFRATQRDPENAHELFVFACNQVYNWGLEGLLIRGRSKRQDLYTELSNAAGLNKNGDIRPQVLQAIGFDRVVVGTVTYDSWQGNPRPRCVRFPKSKSMVNWLGLPGVGAKRVAQTLEKYGNHAVPITINIMSTPKKQGDELLRDLEGTVQATRDLPYVDRFELNISCPNTHSEDGIMDARTDYLSMLDSMIDVVLANVKPDQQLWLKQSPDLEPSNVKAIIDVSKGKITGHTCCNSSTYHDKAYILKSPGKGGASGLAVYSRSKAVQEMFESFDPGCEIIACGGIGNLRTAKERTSSHHAIGIQIYTGLIYEGPRLIRMLRENI